MGEDERIRALHEAMGDYRAHLRELDQLAHLAWREARRLRSPAVGPQEFLRALLHPDAGQSRAAQALRACEVTREAVEETNGRGEGEGEVPDGPQFNPAGLNLQKMAEGLAAGLGDGEVRAEHVLLAYLWDPDSSAWELERLGTSRDEVLGRLAALGVAVPRAPLPAPDPRKYGPQVDVALDDLWILLRELWYVLPPGASFTWNHDGKKGWVSLTEGLDGQEYVERALERRRMRDLLPDDAE